MSDWTVKVDGLWRKFGVSVNSALKYGMIDGARRLVGLRKDSENLRPDEFWALQDVSFKLKPGDALGIMGVNGSGKTTLLRILNGSYSPDRGTVSMRGRVGSLIAAGAGFSPLLSGRENISINALLLGLSPAEIQKRFDDIVDFSGLGKFIDMPVRNYSSGMTVRLGFSIAIMCVPEILLVDEVLAVGDIAFQKRCYDRMLAVRDQGTTIIFVSHSPGAVWSVCNKGLFLNKGISSGLISAEDAVRAYDLQNFRDTAQENARAAQTGAAKTSSASAKEALTSLAREYGGKEGGSGDVLVERFEAVDMATGVAKREFAFGEDIGFRMHVYVEKPISQAIFRYSIDAMHYKFICNADSSAAGGMGLQDIAPGHYIVTTRVKQQRFRPGAYSVNLAVCQKTVGVHLYFRAHAGEFIVRPPTDRFLYDSDSLAVVEFDSEFGITAASDSAAAKGDLNVPVS